MNILWRGQSFFVINTKSNDNNGVRIAIDPFGDELGLRAPKVEADLLLVSHNHPDHSNIKAVKGEPF